MSFFLSGGDYYPRKWSNMSLDMRMVFILFGLGMVTFVLAAAGLCRRSRRRPCSRSASVS